MAGPIIPFAEMVAKMAERGVPRAQQMLMSMQRRTPSNPFADVAGAVQGTPGPNTTVDASLPPPVPGAGEGAGKPMAEILPRPRQEITNTEKLRGEMGLPENPYSPEAVEFGTRRMEQEDVKQEQMELEQRFRQEDRGIMDEEGQTWSKQEFGDPGGLNARLDKLRAEKEEMDQRSLRATQQAQELNQPTAVTPENMPDMNLKQKIMTDPAYKGVEDMGWSGTGNGGMLRRDIHYENPTTGKRQLVSRVETHPDTGRSIVTIRAPRMENQEYMDTIEIPFGSREEATAFMAGVLESVPPGTPMSSTLPFRQLAAQQARQLGARGTLEELKEWIMEAAPMARAVDMPGAGQHSGSIDYMKDIDRMGPPLPWDQMRESDRVQEQSYMDHTFNAVSADAVYRPGEAENWMKQGAAFLHKYPGSQLSQMRTPSGTTVQHLEDRQRTLDAGYTPEETQRFLQSEDPLNPEYPRRDVPMPRPRPRSK